MQKLVLKLMSVILLAAMFTLVSSCDDDDSDSPVFPFHAEIYNTLQGSQVAFQGLTHSAVSWSWDFGDGKTSTEQNPVHVYDAGGYYVAKLTATDSKGETITKSVNLAVDLRPYDYLVGDHTTADYAGKKWKLTKAHTAAGDYLANADATLTSATPYNPIPDGIFASSTFNMGAIYDDTYTFFYDGSYGHDVKADGGAFGGLVYQIATGGYPANILVGNATYGLCIAKYTPEANAKFTFVESEDFKVSSAYSSDGLTFKGTKTLDFSGTEFIGFRDFQRKVVMRSISNTRMQLIMFMAASTAAPGVNTHALILSFEAVTE
jgi:PKD repeat protein